jgi:hypothetical protein
MVNFALVGKLSGNLLRASVSSGFHRPTPRMANLHRDSQQLTQRVKELTERYQTPLPRLNDRVTEQVRELFSASPIRKSCRQLGVGFAAENATLLSTPQIPHEGYGLSDLLAFRLIQSLKSFAMFQGRLVFVLTIAL